MARKKAHKMVGTFRKSSPRKSWVVQEYERVTGKAAVWVNERCAAADEANATLARLVGAEKKGVAA